MPTTLPARCQARHPRLSSALPVISILALVTLLVGLFPPPQNAVALLGAQQMPLIGP